MHVYETWDASQVNQDKTQTIEVKEIEELTCGSKSRIFLSRKIPQQLVSFRKLNPSQTIFSGQVFDAIEGQLM